MTRDASFTHQTIASLKPKTSRYMLWEKSPGSGSFGIRVLPSGKKSWAYMYRFHGTQRLLTLGTFPAMGLADARTARDEAASAVAKGGDPVNERKAERQAYLDAASFESICKLFLDGWAKKQKKSWEEDERRIKKYFTGEKALHKDWAKRKADSIRRADVVALLAGISEKAPIEANRTLSLLKTIFTYAVDQQVLDSSPCVGLKPPAPAKQKDRVLSKAEIRAFWKDIDKTTRSREACTALKLILVTGQRPGEVAAMHHAEIDEDGVWTIPAEKSKNGQSHRVPLSDLARELIDGMGTDGFVFPSPMHGSKRSIDRATLSNAIRLELPKLGIAPFTPHDLRRTAASLMAGAGIEPFTVERVLNHSLGGVQKIYNRYSYDAEKKAALDRWSGVLQGILDEKKAEVVPLSRQAYPFQFHRTAE